MPDAASFSLNADMSGPASASSCDISRSVPVVLEELLFERGMAGGGGLGGSISDALLRGPAPEETHNSGCVMHAFGDTGDGEGPPR
jgi:hypothetical protein